MTNLPTPRPNDPQKSLPTRPFSNPSLARLRNSVGWTAGKPILMQGFTLTEDDRRLLSSSRRDLSAWLAVGRADVREKIVTIAKLLAAFPIQGQAAAASDLRADSYIEALAGLPAWAVEHARLRILRNEIPSLNPGFAPSPAELAGVVKVIVKPYMDDLREIDQISMAGEADKPEPTMTERGFVQQGFADLRDHMQQASDRAEGKAKPEASDAGLRRRAGELGIDYDTAMASIPDARPRIG